MRSFDAEGALAVLTVKAADFGSALAWDERLIDAELDVVVVRNYGDYAPDDLEAARGLIPFAIRTARADALRDLADQSHYVEQKLAAQATGHPDAEVAAELAADPVLFKAYEYKRAQVRAAEIVQAETQAVASGTGFLDRVKTVDEMRPTRGGNGFLVQGVHQHGAVGFTVGASGAGKTLVVMAQVAALAAGTEFFGRATLPDARILWIAGEGEQGFYKRFSGALRSLVGDVSPKAYRKAWKAATARVDVIDGPVLLQRGTPDFEALVKLVAERGYDYIVGDTLSTLAEGLDVNSNREMSLVVACMKVLSRATVETHGHRATVNLLAHTKKDSGRYLGAQSQKADVDAMHTVTAAGTVVTFSNEKAKEGPTGEIYGRFIRTVVSVPMGSDEEGTLPDETTVVIVPAGPSLLPIESSQPKRSPGVQHVAEAGYWLLTKEGSCEGLRDRADWLKAYQSYSEAQGTKAVGSSTFYRQLSDLLKSGWFEQKGHRITAKQGIVTHVFELQDEDPFSSASASTT